MGQNKKRNALRDLATNEDAWLVDHIKTFSELGDTRHIQNMQALYPEAIVVKPSRRVEVHRLYVGHLAETSPTRRDMR